MFIMHKAVIFITIIVLKSGEGNEVILEQNLNTIKTQLVSSWTSIKHYDANCNSWAITKKKLLKCSKRNNKEIKMAH